jgi:hypothetical protein
MLQHGFAALWSIYSSFLEKLAHSLLLRFKAVHLLSGHSISIDAEPSINFGEKIFVHVGAQHSTRLQELVPIEAGLPSHSLQNGRWGYGKWRFILQDVITIIWLVNDITGLLF